MPKLKDQQDADRQFDPYSNPSARDLYRQEQETGNDAAINAGIDQAENFANDPKNASRNIDEARNREETPNEFRYQQSDKPKETTRKFDFKGNLKKKGPMGLLIGILFGGVGGLGLLISPGMAIVQLKEILTDDLNDQLAAMDIRTTHVFRAKLSDMGRGVCTGVKIKCGYKGMSERQLKRFKAAGIEVETDGKSRIPPNRYKVKSLTFRETVGLETREIRVTNPSQLNRLLGDRMVRSGLRKAFNPKFAGFQDKVSAKVFGRFNTTKGDKIGDGTDEDRDKAVDSAVEGRSIDAEPPDKLPVTDEEGNPIEENKDANQQGDSNADRVNSSDGVSTKSLFKSGLSGALKGFGALGVADAACTVKNTARAVEAGAKIYRKRQLIAFAMVFLSFADQVKAGTATPEQAEYVGNKLTAIDTDQMVIDETSALDGENPKEVENPYYGKNAFDSHGYKTALYNEAPTLNARDMQFTLGGATMGTLSKINDFTSKYSDKGCKIVQNPVVRAGSFLVGIAFAIGSFGATTVASIAGSVAISMALPILENYLSQMLAGNIVGSGTEGVDAGNAMFAGSAGMMGDIAMDRGMKPASKDDLEEYMALDQKIENEYIAMETKEAKATPFDIYNRYSFMGSLVRTLMPLRTASSASIGATFANTLSIIPIASSSFSKTTHAQSEYNEDRFSKCEDTGYDDLGIDADIFCNVRYVLSDYELGLDSDEVIDWMASEGFINPDDGSPQDDYVDWLKECTERESGWGEVPEGQENGGEGEQCVKTDKKTSYFRVYTMDRSIFEAMDYEPPVASGAALAGGSKFRIASFNVLGKSHTDGPSANKPGWATWSERIQASLRVIQSNNLEIIAFQEFEPDQRAYLKEHLPNYGQSTHGKDSDSIMWNSDRFDMVGKGTWETVYFGGPIQEPWVKLKDKDTQQEFYVLSVHDPINRGQGSAQTRYENALKHKALVERLQSEAPVLLVGDFNSAYTKDGGAGATSNEKLTYCVIAVNGPMNDAYDLSVPRQEKCPNKPKQGVRNYIDHIYLTPEIEVEKNSFKEIRSGETSNGSDHPTIFSDVVIPGAAENSGAGTDFVIGSYNQPNRGDPNRATAKIVESKMDIVGMQELSGNYPTIRRNLKQNNFGVFPDTYKGPLGHCAIARAIFYNKDKFREVKSEIFDVPSYEANKHGPVREYTDPVDCGGGERTRGGGRANIPVVWLEDIRSQYKGQTIIVMNTHNLANCCGGGGERAAKKRHQAALIYVDKIRELRASYPGTPIFFTGDFNEGTGVRRQPGTNTTYQRDHNNLLYCMFKQDRLMFKAFGSKDQPCRTDHEGIGHVDFVYATPGVQVEWMRSFIDPSTNDSPHPVYYGRLVVPGTKDDSKQGSDVDGDDYSRECGRYTSCTKQCVDFVKFRLLKHGVLRRAISLGNGKDVVSTLGRLGYKVNRTPAVHSVMSTSATSTPQWGHTAMVSAVLKDGSIVVEEYNYANPLAYGKRTISAAEIRSKNMTFAHTEVDYK
jgi:surface antigen